MWMSDGLSFLVSVPDSVTSLWQEYVDGSDRERQAWAEGSMYIGSAVCGGGNWILTFSAKYLDIYDLSTRELLRKVELSSLASTVIGSTTSPQGLVRYTSGTTALVDVLSGKVVQEFTDDDGGATVYVIGASFGRPDESLVLRCGEGELVDNPEFGSDRFGGCKSF